MRAISAKAIAHSLAVIESREDNLLPLPKSRLLLAFLNKYEDVLFNQHPYPSVGMNDALLQKISLNRGDSELDWVPCININRVRFPLPHISHSSIFNSRQVRSKYV